MYIKQLAGLTELSTGSKPSVSNQQNRSNDFASTLGGIQSNASLRSKQIKKVEISNQSFRIAPSRESDLTLETLKGNNKTSVMDSKGQSNKGNDKETRLKGEAEVDSQTNILQFISVQTGIAVEQLQSILRSVGIQQEDLSEQGSVELFLGAVQELFPTHIPDQKHLIQQINQAVSDGQVDVPKEMIGSSKKINVDDEILDLLTKPVRENEQHNVENSQMSYKVKNIFSANNHNTVNTETQIEEKISRKEGKKIGVNEVELDEHSRFGETIEQDDIYNFLEPRQLEQDSHKNVKNLDSLLQSQQSMVHIQKEKLDIPITTNTVARPIPIQPEEIIDQVIQKIDFKVAENHSEIKMQLKPENLGQLSLKIEIERGIVTAKFMVESQQVKEIVESNFNQLQNTLEKQGLQVQQMSVSVGQENAEQQRQALQQQANKVRKVGKLNSEGDAQGIYTEAIEEAIQKRNPYLVFENAVDYMA